MTCVDDSLNYLRDGDELALALGGIAANLAPHGLGVFDLNTLRGGRARPAGRGPRRGEQL